MLHKTKYIIEKKQQDYLAQDAAEIMALDEWFVTLLFKQPDLSYAMGHKFLSTIAQYLK